MEDNNEKLTHEEKREIDELFSTDDVEKRMKIWKKYHPHEEFIMDDRGLQAKYEQFKKEQFDELCSEIEKDVINDKREAKIISDSIYVLFYEENGKIVSCNKEGYPERTFDSISELFKSIGLNEKTFEQFDISTQ